MSYTNFFKNRRRFFASIRPWKSDQLHPKSLERINWIYQWCQITAYKLSCREGFKKPGKRTR